MINKPLRLLRLPALAILVALDSGCAVNPVTGNREVVLLSVDSEKEIGAENAQQVEKEMGLFQNPALLDYTQAIGNRLAEHSPYQEVSYQFQIVDSEDPNAFALPGGYVYVSRGLLVLVNSEDELAGVIGHEIGHVAARHGVQRLTRSAPIGLVTGITSAAVGIVSSSLSNVVSGTGSLLNSAILAPYSRGQENDADAIGQELAAKAGWNPEGITLFLNTLNREVARKGGDSGRIAFLSTHPSTPERVSKTEQRASEIEYNKVKSIAKNHAAFLDKLNGLIIGEDVRQGVIIGRDFLHPTMNIGMTFPEAWEIVNHPDYVVAVAKGQGATIMLQLQGEGIDPGKAASSFLDEANLGNKTVKKITISGLPASRVVLDRRGQKAIITWVAYKGDIYRLIAVSKNNGANYSQVLRKTMSSFHQLSSSEKTKIRQQRLRIISARKGEKLAALLKRAGSTWDEETCAIANNLQVGDVLKERQLVKVAISEVFKK